MRTLLLWLLCLVVVICAVVTHANIEHMNATFEWSFDSAEGNASRCSAAQCSAQGLVWSPSSRHMNTSDAEELAFCDPSVNFTGIHNVSKWVLQRSVIDLTGRYNCDRESIGSLLDLELDEQSLHNAYNGSYGPVSPSGCDTCSNCGERMRFAQQFINYWPGYNYKGRRNSVSLFIDKNAIALSALKLTLSYAPVLPGVESCSPNASPLSGGTVVTIAAETDDSFNPDQLVSCMFGNHSVASTYISPHHLECVAPPNDAVGAVGLFLVAQAPSNAAVEQSHRVYIEPSVVHHRHHHLHNVTCDSSHDYAHDGVASTRVSGVSPFDDDDDVLQFFYYTQPTAVVGIEPKSAPTSGGVSVEVQLSPVSQVPDLNAAACSFGNHTVSASDVRDVDSVITLTCITPRMKSSGVVPFNVSLDGQHWLSGESYRFTASSLPLWIILAILGGAVVVLIVALLIGLMIRRRFHSSAEASGYSQLRQEALKHSSVNLSGAQVIWDSAVDELPDLELKGEQVHVGVKLGKGAYGDVYMATWRGTPVVLKSLLERRLDDTPDRRAKYEADFLQEASMMRELRHPNVVQMLGVIHQFPRMYIMLEYMSRGSLYDMLHPRQRPTQSYAPTESASAVSLPPLPIRLRIMLQVARGMHYLHTCKPPIIHRDLKPHNILLDDAWRAKVADFGLSAMWSTLNHDITPAGTPLYSAPEVLRNQKITLKSDVYGFGITLWECVTTKSPFPGLGAFQVINAVARGRQRPPIPIDMSVEIASFVEQCWSEVPEARPSFGEVLTQMQSIIDSVDSDAR